MCCHETHLRYDAAIEGLSCVAKVFQPYSWLGSEESTSLLGVRAISEAASWDLHAPS